MTQTSEIGTLRDYLSVLRRRRLIVLVATVAAALAAFAYSVLKEPVYKATATISFEDPTEQAGALLGQPAADFFPADKAAVGAQLVTRRVILDGVRERLNTDLSTEDLQNRIATEVQIDSNLVAIEATADSAELAARLANAVAREARLTTRRDARQFFSDSAKALGGSDAISRAIKARLRSLAELADPVDIVRPAEVPVTPTAPRPLRDMILAAVIGLLLGIALAFLRNSLDRRVTESQDAQSELGFPLVGSVRTELLGLGLSANGSVDAKDEDLEAFRIIRANTEFLTHGQARSVAVTSALPEEGKSTVAAWYAYANALSGRRTVLAECDLRRPVLAERLDLAPSPGLSDYLAGGAKPKEVLRSIPVDGPEAVNVLPLIPAGRPAFQPAELLGSSRFKEFLEQITGAYELAVIDTPPLLPVGDTLELLPQVDGLLICVRLGQTTRDQLAAIKEVMKRHAEMPTGLVITGVEVDREHDYYGYYSSRAPASTPPARTG